ncbi:MAG: hypothetical protein ACPHY8_05070 [Patescibacteria group bacterium]
MTLNFDPGLVFGAIFSFAFCPYTPVTSILHHKIKSKIGISYVFSKSKLTGSCCVCVFLCDCCCPQKPLFQNKSPKSKLDDCALLHPAPQNCENISSNHPKP